MGSLHRSVDRLARRKHGPEARRLLLRKGLLAPRGHAALRSQAFAETIARGQDAFRDEGVAVLPGVVEGEALATIQRYCKELHAAGLLIRMRADNSDRIILADDPLIRLIHLEMSQVIAQIVSSPVVPSYSLLARYSPGAILHRHVDRPQCLWNVSFVVDTEPAVALAEAWPLHFETKSGKRTALLAPGDAAIYSGTETPHWRDALAPDRSVTIAFFHFVKPGFAGDLL